MMFINFQTCEIELGNSRVRDDSWRGHHCSAFGSSFRRFRYLFQIFTSRHKHAESLVLRVLARFLQASSFLSSIRLCLVTGMLLIECCSNRLIRCRLKLEQLPRGIMPSQYSDPCKPGLHITDKRLTSVKFLQFIRDAVYAYAHALHNQWQVECEGRPGVCEKMRNAEGSVLKYYLEGASFTGKNRITHSLSFFIFTR
jgi:hypothetical protein